MYDKLKAYQESGKAIQVGATGAGWMGSGFVAAVKNVPGMEVSVLADEDPGLARKVWSSSWAELLRMIVSSRPVNPARLRKQYAPANG